MIYLKMHLEKANVKTRVLEQVGSKELTQHCSLQDY